MQEQEAIGPAIEQEEYLSEQTDRQTSTIIELACQDKTSSSTALTPGNGRKIIMSEQSQRQTSPDIELGCQASTVTDSALTPGLGMGQDTGLNTEKKISMSEQSEIKTSTVIELACQADTVRDTAKTPGLSMRQGSPAKPRSSPLGHLTQPQGWGRSKGKSEKQSRGWRTRSGRRRGTP